MTELEKAICNQYDNGRYRPLGADGGVLKYIMVNINGQWYNASITLDHELTDIRRIWALSEVNENNERTNKLYDYTQVYYELRKAK